MQHIARALLTPHLLQEPKHLALDLGRPVQELLAEGAILLLRYHGRGAGFPEPEPPTASSGTRTKKGGAR